MAKINLLEDVGVPLAVTAVSLGLRSSGKSEKYQPIVGVVSVAAGYFMQMTGRAPVIGNRLAVASFPAAAIGIYDWARGAMSKGTTSRAGGRAVSARTMSISADPLLQYRKGGL